MQPKRLTMEQRRQAVREECRRRRISITPSGKGAFHLVGPGVDLLAADLALVDMGSLKPAFD
ncbi:hypothetical protein AZOA_07390 [Azoarcus sp. Aa7]|nr:hypothetical protein [Azoarcus sp. Aa7]